MFQLYTTTTALLSVLRQVAYKGVSGITEGTSEGKRDVTFKVSDGDNIRMRRMCSIPENIGDELF